MGLSHQQRASRLAYDYKVAMSMIGPVIPSIITFTDNAAFASNNPIGSEEQASSAQLYKVAYRVRTLKGQGKFMDQCTTRFDLLAGGNYPFTPPLVTVISRPTPWSPHFHSSGTVCIGEGWRKARGKMLLAQLILHVAHLLNFDEPDRGRLYGGYNPTAAQYWRKKYKCQPLNPDLAYPELPTELVHGVAARPAFQPVGPRPFAPVPEIPTLTTSPVAFRSFTEEKR